MVQILQMEISVAKPAFIFAYSSNFATVTVKGLKRSKQCG